MGTLFWTPEFFEIYERLGRSYGVPILVAREDRTPPLATAYEGAVLIDRVLAITPGVPPEQWLETYKQMLAPLPPGVYQLIVHLGHDDEEMEAATSDHPDWGAEWRQADFDLVRNQEFQDFLREQGFILLGWDELARALPAREVAGP